MKKEVHLPIGEEIMAVHKPKPVYIPTPDPAIVLLSGGLDSATALAVAKQSHSGTITALSFDYGQRHLSELQAAKKVARTMNVEQYIIDISLNQFGASALTDRMVNVPMDREIEEMTSDIPITYVPARNTIMLSYAIALADARYTAEKNEDLGHNEEDIGYNRIFIYTGMNVLDYSGYPDCRPTYIAAFEEMANKGTRIGSEGGKLIFQTPLIHKTKAEIIQLGTMLGVDYSMTVSCYQANEHGHACGKCDSCILRREGFEKAGIEDPTIYQ